MDGICQILQSHLSGFSVFSYLFTYITGKITHFVSSYYLFFLLIYIVYDYIGKTGIL